MDWAWLMQRSADELRSMVAEVGPTAEQRRQVLDALQVKDGEAQSAAAAKQSKWVIWGFAASAVAALGMIWQVVVYYAGGR